MKITQTRKVVMRMLADHYALRDDDNALIANIWARELQQQGYDTKQMLGFEFLASLAMGKLSSPESITRMRRKLQNEFPSLRGLTYEQRHKEADNVQKELGYGTV